MYFKNAWRMYLHVGQWPLAIIDIKMYAIILALLPYSYNCYVHLQATNSQYFDHHICKHLCKLLAYVCDYIVLSNYQYLNTLQSNYNFFITIWILYNHQSYDYPDYGTLENASS